MSMTHVDNMTTNVWNDIAFDIAVDENGKLNQNLFDCTIEELKDEYINKLQKENEKLRESLVEIIDYEYGNGNLYSEIEESQELARQTLKELEK